MKHTPILILHGWNLSGKKYSPLIKILKAKNFTVFAPDLPGFGKGDKLKKPLKLEDYVDYVASFLQEKDIVEAVVIGHSFGGRIGILLAIKYPNKIKALILSGTPAILPVSKAKIRISLLMAKLGKAFLSLPCLAFLKKFARKLFYKVVGAWDYYNTKGVIRETFKNIIRHDLEKNLAEVKVPTLVIWGERDQIVQVSLGEEIAKRIPKASWVSIKDGGHGIAYERAEEFAEEIVSFIDKNETNT